jgi:hypothetical protein
VQLLRLAGVRRPRQGTFKEHSLSLFLFFFFSFFFLSLSLLFGGIPLVLCFVREEREGEGEGEEAGLLDDGTPSRPSGSKPDASKESATAATATATAAATAAAATAATTAVPPSSEPGSRLVARSELLATEVSFLEKLQAGLRRGDVDDMLILFLRSQHLHMPHLHAHPVYSLMRACAAAGAAGEVLLGTADVSWPHPASEFGRSNFDQLFAKASTRLPPQQRLDYRELSSALGLMFSDRSVAALRWCFGDVFHGTLEDAEADLVEAEEEEEEEEEEEAGAAGWARGAGAEMVNGEAVDGVPGLSFKRRRRSKPPLPLLEHHLIKERAANFSPLVRK